MPFPEEFVEVKYPEYYWNIKDKCLYTHKISKRYLHKLSRANPYYMDGKEGYNVSVNGRRRRLYLDDLNRLVPKI